MTGFESKRQAAQNKMNDDADTLSIVYQRGFADGKRAAQPEQEPVAWMVKLGDVTCFHHHADSKHASVPLYTTPPAAQREWVGLTDEDVNRESAPITSQMKLAFHAGMYVAQKLLKERNT